MTPIKTECPRERLVRYQLERAHHHWAQAAIAGDSDEAAWRERTELLAVRLQEVRAAA